ncbi:hypothetical protein [Prevotella falsenii]|uniref:hypothetical protein n=1 Tax=Prevotella falsenii TaxID=515414 RepID=UPI004032A415
MQLKNGTQILYDVVCALQKGGRCNNGTRRFAFNGVVYALQKGGRCNDEAKIPRQIRVVYALQKGGRCNDGTFYATPYELFVPCKKEADATYKNL